MVASSWNQAPNICKSKRLSRGGKGPPPLPADVIGAARSVAWVHGFAKSGLHHVCLTVRGSSVCARTQ